MSLKRYATDITDIEEPTQIDDYEMPRFKRQRSTRGNPFRKNRMLVRASRVPRAIRSRGTPDGYYEIPVTVYRKIYFNMSTGLWNTDAYTGVQSGTTGYNGFGLGTQLDVSRMTLGNGGAASAINVNIPGFTELQGVFDECKIARIHYEFWLGGQAHENGSVLRFAPNIWIAVDNNNVDPPANQATLLQYSSVRCVKGDITLPTKMTVYPKVRDSLATGLGEGDTTTTDAATTGATYMSMAKPAAFHYCLRGWFETNAGLGEAYLGYLCIKETQIRRYKVTK